MTFRRTGFKPTSRYCFVFDMDDVLCHYDPEITLRDAHTFEPKTEYVELAKMAKRDGCDIVVATARKSFHQWKTWRWLEAQGLEVSAAYHRDSDSTQSSSDAKRDMLTDIMKTWEIITFFDDSPFNVSMARDLGVDAVQVEGNEEFWAQRGDT